MTFFRTLLHLHFPILTAAILLFPQPEAAARDALRFDETRIRAVNLKWPGSDQVKCDNSRTSDGRNIPVISWGEPAPQSIELEIQSETPKLPPFDRALFALRLHVPEPLTVDRISLRLMDAGGEVFQFVKPLSDTTLHGDVTLEYTVAEGATRSIWGGDKNRSIDWPLHVWGFAVDRNEKTLPGGKILLDAVEYFPSGECADLTLDTGHWMNLLLPDGDRLPVLNIHNIGTGELQLKGSLTITDSAAEQKTVPVSVTVPENSVEPFPLPGDFTSQGWWRIDAELRSAGGKIYRNTFRMGRMNPAGPTPGRAEEFLFGLCGHPERFPAHEAELEAEAAGLCGAKIMRFDFTWNRIETQPGQWDFSLYDRIVTTLARNGVEPQCLLYGCVPWAVSSQYQPRDPRYVNHSPLPDADRFADFAARVAAHYRNRIKYFEIWNEPDLVVFANFPAEQYMELLIHGYDAIRKTVPEAVVMTAGIATVHTNSGGNPDHNNGLFELLLADGGRHFDLLAFHGHGTPTYYRDLLGVLEKYGLIGAGAPRRWYSNETAEHSARIGEMRQAEYLFRKFLIAWSHDAVGYNWYLLREKNYFAEGQPERHFGLITPDFQPKPGYITYNMLAATYRGGRFLRQLPAVPGVTALLFEDARGNALLALWNDHTTRSVLIAGIPGDEGVKIDLFGNETALPVRDGALSLPVSSRPFTLKFRSRPREEQFRVCSILEEPPPLLELEPGNVSGFPLKLHNPLKQPLKLQLQLSAPDHVSVENPVGNVVLSPEEERDLTFNLTAAPEFSASLGEPGSLQIILTAKNQICEHAATSLIRRTVAGAPLFILNSDAQYHTFVPSGMPGSEALFWQGPDDLSAELFLTREKETLHLSVIVRDDRHVQPYSGASVWKGDNIQFALHLPEGGAKWKLGLTHQPDGKSEVYCWRSSSAFTGPFPELSLKTARDESRKETRYDVVIPFHAVGLTPAAAANGFKFNLIVNDNDGSLREGYMAASPTMTLDDESDETWPLIRLP